MSISMINGLRVPYIGIQLTEKCTARCRHCGTLSSPKRQQCFDKDFLSQVIDKVAGIGKPEIGFTGGEPFTEPKLLFYGIAKARELGLPYGVTTNGFWGRDPLERRRVLAMIYDCKSLGLSLDLFHAEFVPEQTVFDILREALEKGITCSIRYTLTASQSRESVLEKIKRANIDVEKNICFAPLMPVGRAKKLIAEKEFPEDKDSNTFPCTAASVPTITASGNVYACCGEAIYMQPPNPLLLGSIHDKPLSDIILQRNKNLAVMAVRTMGPMMLARTPEIFNTISPNNYYLRSHCGCCQLLFLNKQAVEITHHVLLGLRQKIAALAALYYGDVLYDQD